MKNTPNERVAIIRNDQGMRQPEFAKELAIGQAALSMIETGKRELSEKNAKIICLKFNVNYDWLMYGDGEMYNTVLPEDDELDILVRTAMPNSNDETRKMIKKMMKADDKFWENLRGIVEYLSN